jgi:hypothetical protein
MRRSRLNSGRARAALGWTVLAFAAAQVGLDLALERCRPDVNDPEFETRAALLARCRRAEPDRPLLLVMGSSRLVTGFRPGAVAPLRTESGAVPLTFNFAHYGAGPVMNLVQVNRLLDDNIRPRWIVLEIMPAFLALESGSLMMSVAATGDLPCLHPYLGSGKLYGRWLRSRLLPCVKHRNALCRLAVADVEPEDAEDWHFDALGGYRETPRDLAHDPALVAQYRHRVHAEYHEPLQHFQILPANDGALRETIVKAGRAGVQVALLVTPEASSFRGWYAPGTDAVLDAYYRDLAKCYGVPVIDARACVADREFVDGHHLFAGAARRFSQHLGREVLAPLVAGQLSGVVRATPMP